MRKEALRMAEAGKPDQAGNGESDQAGKAGAWIGIAASIITVLAFFGVSDWNQLRHALFSQQSAGSSASSAGASRQARPPNAIACALAKDAVQTADTQGRSVTGNAAAYAEVLEAEGYALGNAATTTADPVLQAYLKEEANALQQDGQDLQGHDSTGALQWENEAATYGWDQLDYCMRHS